MTIGGLCPSRRRLRPTDEVMLCCPFCAFHAGGTVGDGTLGYGRAILDGYGGLLPGGLDVHAVERGRGR